MKKLIISCSSTEKVTLNFWKMFFQLCGIWVSERPIASFDPENNEDSCLMILGNEDQDKIKKEEDKKIFYTIKKNATFSNYRKRSDTVIFNWYSEDKSSFEKVVEYLFPEKTEVMQIKKMLRLFIENQFWGTAWLFQELAMKDRSRFDSYIVEKSRLMLDALNNSTLDHKNFHVAYMKLFCQYMMKCAGNRSLLDRIITCQELIEKCMELAEVEQWNPILYVLMGKISEASQAERKFAISYYEKALQFEKKPELLYDIGHIYETMYGEEKKAAEFYQKTYEVDGNFYRGLYKIAFFSEKDGDWKNALKIYGQILGILERIKDSSSIHGMMYEYKTNRRLREIFRKHFAVRELVAEYSAKITEFEETLMQDSRFEVMFHCMFGVKEEKYINHQVLEEISDRLEEICSKI